MESDFCKTKVGIRKRFLLLIIRHGPSFSATHRFVSVKHVLGRYAESGEKLMPEIAMQFQHHVHESRSLHSGRARAAGGLHSSIENIFPGGLKPKSVDIRILSALGTAGAYAMEHYITHTISHLALASQYLASNTHKYAQRSWLTSPAYLHMHAQPNVRRSGKHRRIMRLN